MVTQHIHLLINNLVMLHFQVALVLWLSALTATTTPTSTLAHGNIAPMLI